MVNQLDNLVCCRKWTWSSRIVSSSSSSGVLEYKPTHFRRLIFSPSNGLLVPWNQSPRMRFLQPSRGAVSRLMESMAADEDFEPNQDSSFSEDELLPPCSNSVSERSSTPGQCTETPPTAASRCDLFLKMMTCLFTLCVVVFSSRSVCVGQGFPGGRTQSFDPNGWPASVRRTRQHGSLPWHVSTLEQNLTSEGKKGGAQRSICGL